MCKRKAWAESEIELVRKLFPDNYTADVCAILKRSYSSVCMRAYLMGLKKSDDFKAMELAKQGERLKVVGAKNRFTKGREPENKGKPMSKEMYEKCKATMFKKGHIPHNSKNIGEEVIRTHKGVKYWMVKVAGERKLLYKHTFIWENKNGKVPKGFNVVFKDGNTLNCAIENLECISNEELMYRNSKHNYPTEIVPTLTILNKIKKKINEKQNN